MVHHESDEELHAKLVLVNAALARHPLVSERVTRAHAIIESTDSDDKEMVNKTLRDEGLPDLAELGRVQVRYSFSWWKLHQQRIKLVQKLEQFKP